MSSSPVVASVQRGAPGQKRESGLAENEKLVLHEYAAWFALIEAQPGWIAESE